MAFKASLFGSDKVNKCLAAGGHFPNGSNVLRPAPAARPPGMQSGEGDHTLERWATCGNCGTKYKVPLNPGDKV